MFDGARTLLSATPLRASTAKTGSMSVRNRPVIYWGVHAVLTGPLVLLWAGVAYWFGFGSGAILKTVFPPMAAPLALFALTTAAFGWTAIHSKNLSPDDHV